MYLIIARSFVRQHGVPKWLAVISVYLRRQLEEHRTNVLEFIDILQSMKNARFWPR